MTKYSCLFFYDEGVKGEQRGKLLRGDRSVFIPASIECVELYCACEPALC